MFLSRYVSAGDEAMNTRSSRSENAVWAPYGSAYEHESSEEDKFPAQPRLDYASIIRQLVSSDGQFSNIILANMVGKRRN
jgi:hypothetical protein